MTIAEQAQTIPKESWTPAPFPGRQTWFLQAQDVSEIAFLGMKGPGKSFTFCLDALYGVDEHDYRALIVRKTFNDLRDIIDKTRRLYPAYGAFYNGGDHTWYFPSGATIRFGYLDHPTDLERYIGNEFHAIYVDECGQVPLEWYLELGTCIRTVNPNIQCKLRCASNPVGKYVTEYWSRFVDQMPEGEKTWFYVDEEGVESRSDETNIHAESRMWFKCLREENPLLNIIAYEKMLRKMPFRKRMAYLKGELVLDSAPNQLITYEALDEALARDPDEQIEGGFWILSVDVAGQGNDSTVFTFGFMHKILEVTEFKGNKTPEIKRRVAEYLNKYKLNLLVVIDAQGMGVGPFEELQEMFPLYAHHIVGVGSATSEMAERRKRDKFTTNLKFGGDATRSWYWWKARMAFEEGRINLALLKHSPYLNILRRELGFITYTDDISGEIRVASKKEIRPASKMGGSPDFADSLCYYILGLMEFREVMGDRYIERKDLKKLDYGAWEDDDDFDMSSNPGNGFI